MRKGSLFLGFIFFQHTRPPRPKFRKELSVLSWEAACVILQLLFRFLSWEAACVLSATSQREVVHYSD